MSTEPFIGEVKIFGFNFAPKGYMLCAGQILSIAQNSALFSLLGTTYGGNGQTTFGLPDLQGRMPIGQGTGPGLPSHSMGEMAGTTSVTLLSSNLPAHIHTMNNVSVKIKASNANADESSPQDGFPGLASTSLYTSAAQPGVYTGGTQVTGTTDITGSNIPFSIMNPYLVMNYSIAIYGIFPSRN
ncbi:phage tail protein [Flavobacterium sp. ARAG 55.4]|uniref:phage tail protein n=1 Tax=Flavobacterium sp. ARAG 55.4 TaxID=3451357 RepID=UPI003F48DCAB